MKRRWFIRSMAAVAVLANNWAAHAESGLKKTPRDYEGPYYPTGPRHRTNDVVVGEPRSQLLNLTGRIVDTDGAPLRAALFDFWQADPLGRYRHPRDRTPGERWDDFLYWGEATTDDDGRFSVRTYVPGDYGGRPAHVHYKVWSKKKSLLTSQIYFAELGGARGAARSSAADEQQTVNLQNDGENAVRAELQVVV